MNSKYFYAKNIKNELDGYVIGQEKGTRAIAMAIAQHIQQTFFDWYPQELSQTDNILLIGPTGCGKTETYRILKKIEKEIECPIAIFNMLDYAPTNSWQGESITKIFDDIIKQSLEICFSMGYNENTDIAVFKKKIIDIANRAIIFFDETDKIAMEGDGKNRSFFKDYQSNLLKMIEGNTYEVSDYTFKKKYHKTNEDGEQLLYTESKTLDNMQVNTTHMMFIFAGAFDGIQNITRFRLDQENKQKKETQNTNYQGTHLGFMINVKANKSKPIKKYTYEELIPSQEDIIQYGFMRELIGRIPVRTVYEPLNVDKLVHILLNSKTSAYKKYQQRFSQNGHHMLRCNREALKEIARIAIKRGTGARGLMNIFSELLLDTQYELSDNTNQIHCLLRGKEIREHKPPLLHNVSKKHKKKKKKKTNLSDSIL